MKSKKRTITLDECMSMTEAELDEFMEKNNLSLKEGQEESEAIPVDLMGMSGEEIAKKYNLTPLDVIDERITKKLMGRK